MAYANIGIGAYFQTAQGPSVSSFDFPLTVSNGDTVFLVFSPANVANVTVTFPNNLGQNWVLIGNGSAGLNTTRLQVWLVESAVAASGTVTIQRSGTGWLIFGYQIFSNVAMVDSFRTGQIATNNTDNPFVFSAVDFPAKSMNVTAVGFPPGAAGGADVNLITVQDTLVRVSGGTPLFILGRTFTQESLANPGSSSFSVPSGLPNTNKAAFRFLPVEAPTPPEPGGTIKEIKDQIAAWRLAEHRHGSDKLYMLRGAARRAKLAEIQALADALKAAQGAQIQSMS